MTTNNNDDEGQAFPGQQGSCPDGTWNQTYDPGMSLRDWFAGMALTGVLSPSSDGSEYPTEQDAAEAAYRVADAMINARKP